MPFTIIESGKNPSYLPDIISGLPSERSGIKDGNSCNKYKKEKEKKRVSHYMANKDEMMKPMILK